MIVVDKEVMVDGPIEKVYGYVSDPDNLVRFCPSVLEIQDVRSLPNGGYSARWVYKMAGMRSRGTGEFTAVVPNSYFVVETTGGVKSRITCTFRSWEDITKVTLTVEYTVPKPLLHELAEAIIVKMNDREADLIMANLQVIFTAGTDLTRRSLWPSSFLRRRRP